VKQESDVRAKYVAEMGQWLDDVKPIVDAVVEAAKHPPPATFQSSISSRPVKRPRVHSPASMSIPVEHAQERQKIEEDISELEIQVDNLDVSGVDLDTQLIERREAVRKGILEMAAHLDNTTASKNMEVDPVTNEEEGEVREEPLIAPIQKAIQKVQLTLEELEPLVSKLQEAEAQGSSFRQDVDSVDVQVRANLDAVSIVSVFVFYIQLNTLLEQIEQTVSPDGIHAQLSKARDNLNAVRRQLSDIQNHNLSIASFPAYQLSEMADELFEAVQPDVSALLDALHLSTARGLEDTFRQVEGEVRQRLSPVLRFIAKFRQWIGEREEEINKMALSLPRV
jgi:hypothetical protein